jgi:hypothetical protein
MEREMSVPGFWDRPEAAQELGRKRSRVEKRIAAGESINSKAEELDVLLELQREGETVDDELDQLVVIAIGHQIFDLTCPLDLISTSTIARS